MDYAYVTNIINIKSAVSDRLKIKSNKGIQQSFNFTTHYLTTILYYKTVCVHYK